MSLLHAKKKKIVVFETYSRARSWADSIWLKTRAVRDNVKGRGSSVLFGWTTKTDWFNSCRTPISSPEPSAFLVSGLAKVRPWRILGTRLVDWSKETMKPKYYGCKIFKLVHINTTSNEPFPWDPIGTCALKSLVFLATVMETLWLTSTKNPITSGRLVVQSCERALNGNEFKGT